MRAWEKECRGQLPPSSIRTLTCSFAVITFLFPQNAHADYFDLDPEQLLSAQVVTVGKRSSTIADTPAAVYVLTSEDIQRSGVTNIPDALRMVPGVNVARSDSNSWAVSIRGFNSGLANKLLVLLDGRTIYNPVFGGVLWEAQDLMLSDIDRIEVVRGPGGTLWGANAVNGVINILTKHARDTQGNIVSTLYGNEEHGTLAARHGGTFGEDRYYRVYAKGFDRDSSRKADSTDTYDEWAGMRTGFRADWGDAFTLQGDMYRNHTQQLRPRFQLVAPFAEDTNQTLEYEGINLLGRWTEKNEDGSQITIQSYLDYARRDEPLNFVDSRLIYDLEGQYDFAPMGAHEVIAGAGFRYSADNEKGDANTSFAPEGRRDSLYNVFIQDKIALVDDKWYLTLGSKFEHNDYSGFEIQPSARLQWHPDEKQTVWTAVSRAVRTPTPIETDLTSTLATAAFARAAFVPNEDFKSEEVIAYEMGYRNQIAPDLSVDLAAFYNQYDNLSTTTALTPSVILVPLHLFIPIQFTNDMEGRSFGFEMSTTWDVMPDLRLTANYSYLRMLLDGPSADQEDAEHLAPLHQLGVRASWDISENFSMDVSASYVDDLEGHEIDAYTKVDVNLGWKITDQIRFNLVGQNLLDDANREFGEVDDRNAGEIERSVFGKVTWEF